MSAGAVRRFAAIIVSLLGVPTMTLSFAARGAADAPGSTAAPKEPARDDSCAAADVCLAPIASLGVDDDERGAFEVALVRATGSKACEGLSVLDETCFFDDACVARASERAIQARVFVAGDRVRVTWALALVDGVRRGESSAVRAAFLSAGALPEVAGVCAELAPKPAPAAVPAATGPVVVPAGPSAPALPGGPIEDASPAPAQPLMVMGAGGAVLVASLAAVSVSAVVLETAEIDGGPKEAATIAGWVALAGIVAGAGVLGFGAWMGLSPPGPG